MRRSPRICAGCSRTCATPSRTGPRWRRSARRSRPSSPSTPPAGLGAEEVAKARGLLEWLTADHFTFLGYREYTLLREAGEDVLRAVPGTGLGLLRYDQPRSGSFGRLTAEARAKARDTQLLIITKANSRATVHRSTYLDYVGVKTFDEQGAVTGSGASWGCSPRPPTPSRCSGCRSSRRRSPRSWSGRASPPTATRARTCSRSWRPTPATSCSRPTPTSSTTSRPRCCTCRSGARPGCSCARTSTAGSCPAWSTSPATATPRPCG